MQYIYMYITVCMYVHIYYSDIVYCSLRLCVKSLHNTSGKDSAIVKTTEEELDQLEIRLPKVNA